MVSPGSQAGVMLLVLLFGLTTGASYATTSVQGWGRVNMNGAIIDTACAIAAGSRFQTVEMENSPLGNIIRDGQGGAKSFSIELVNCVLERPGNKTHWKFFQVTFDGYAEGSLFGLQGEARGVALKINDSSGNAIIPGKPLPMEGITQGNKTLSYSMRLVPNHQPLKVGAYFSTVRFKLDYF